jgi:penicillin-binding protein 1C
MPRTGIGKIAARAAFGAVVACVFIYIGFEAYVWALPPLDLVRAEKSSVLVLSEDRQLLKAYLTDDGMWRLRTTPRDVPPRYLSMLLGYEDKRFFSHRGIDPLAVLRATWQLISHGRVVSGASTLTMQTVRLLGGQQPGLLGKLRQAALAVKLERQFDKDAILSIYLTLAPFGGNVEGVRAASLRYFGVEPRDMTVGQSALLVAIPQSPERRRPLASRTSGREARDWVLARMERSGILSRDQVVEARNEPALVIRRGQVFLAHHLSDRLRNGNPDQHEFDTLIDRYLQKRIESIASEFAAKQVDRAGIAILVIRNHDLAVRAYLGGANYFDNDRAGMLDLARAIRSPGSTLKPVIYGLAFEELIVHPNTIVTDDVIRFPGYAPENFDKKYRGELLVHEALVQSLNTVAVMLLDLIGPDRFLTRLRNAGIAVELPEAKGKPGLAVALGGLGIDLEELAKLFAGIANGGRVRPLRYLAADGNNPGLELMSPDAAWAVGDILADMPPPRGRTSLLARDGGRRIAYKTGTSYGYKDAWTVGFDADHTVAVWIGRPDAIGRPGETGAGAAAPIMHRIFDQLPVPDHDVAANGPRNSVLARTTDLPERLRRYSSSDSPATSAAARSFEIRFPVNGSTVRLSRRDSAIAPITVWATGGRAPFRWYIDGKSLTDQTAENRIVWTPPGRGQVDIVVIDANGAKAKSTAWLE